MNFDRVISLIMAAGCSKRFRSDKRAAMLYNGKGLLESTVYQSKKSFKNTYVVLRRDDNLQTLSLDSSTQVIRVKGVTKGLGDSLSYAFGYLDKDLGFSKIQGAVVWLGDMPWVKASTCNKVVSSANSSLIVRPCYLGVPGHPVFFGRNFWRQLSDIKDSHSGKEVIHKNINSYVEVNVSDKNIHNDVDFPDDIYQTGG